MSIQIVLHLSPESKVTHEDCIIEGKVDGRARGPPNFEQPSGIQLRENSGYVKSLLIYLKVC